MSAAAATDKGMPAGGIATARLRVILPGDILVDEEIVRLVAEAEDGSFGMLPRHADFVTSLPPGVVEFTCKDGRERFVGLDEAVLVKREDDILLSARDAVVGDDLAALRALVENRFRHLGEAERAARGALARLEVGIARRFLELKERP